MKTILTAAVLAAVLALPATAQTGGGIMKMDSKPGSMAMSGDTSMKGMAMKPMKKSHKKTTSPSMTATKPSGSMTH